MRHIHALIVFETVMFWGCVPTVSARGRQTQHKGQRTAVFLVKPDNGMIKCEDTKPLVLSIWKSSMHYINPNGGQLMSLHHAQMHK